MDIENRTVWDKSLEVNVYKEPKIVAICANSECRNELTDADIYLRTSDGDSLCDLFCYEKYGLQNDLIEIVDKNK